MAGFYRIGSRLIHSGRRHWECRQPRSQQIHHCWYGQNFVPTQTLQYCSIVKCSAYWAVPFRSIDQQSSGRRPEPVWAWEIMSSSDQPPVPGRTIILQQKRNGHAIVVRENNTITHEMYWWKDSTEPTTQGNDFQTILGRFRTQMTTKPTNTFVSCHLYGSVP
jgi:hypothetical protein